MRILRIKAKACWDCFVEYFAERVARRLKVTVLHEFYCARRNKMYQNRLADTRHIIGLEGTVAILQGRLEEKVEEIDKWKSIAASKKKKQD